MERLILKKIEDWYNRGEKHALMVDGARQVGKTYIIRAFAEKNCESFVEINFINLTKSQRETFSRITRVEQLVTLVSSICDTDLIPGKSVIFFDEVQECVEMITAIKFLVEDGRFRYILSGSLLGIEIARVRSMPVGYMTKLHMYPMNFEEFCVACGIRESVLSSLRDSFDNITPIEDYLHERFTELYTLYLIVGGMPEAVQRYLDTKSLRAVRSVQKDICDIYRDDITKYEKTGKPHITEIFNKLPSELNSQNKRFKLNTLSEGNKFKYAENSFLWLTDAGIAHPVYCAKRPEAPLELSTSRNLMKLFLCDVGLLASMYMEDDDGVQAKILVGDSDVNFGAIFENAVCQELISNGFKPYYFNSKKYGELDLLIQLDGKAVPIEIKSGKTYNRYSALCNVLKSTEYDIDRAYIFINKNKVEKNGKKVIMPVYMSMFLGKKSHDEMIYNLDLNGLNDLS